MSPLENLIRARIAADGPMPVADYMSLALGHPEHGYYMRRDPFGLGGDFITAPEISQVFGELIGLWAAVAWQQLGSPGKIALVECGPGRGTLIADALRAARTVPAFVDAVELHLVETSPALRVRQQESLPAWSPFWHSRLDTLPRGPFILIANEFFDALPVHQYQLGDAGWTERTVTATENGLAFASGPAADPAPLPDDTPERGDILERSPASEAVAEQIGRRIAEDGGAALIVDYGHREPGFGDTFQAVRRHGYADPLKDPGEADLTAHVDFTALSSALRRGGADTFGPVTQGEFLVRLGVEARTEALARKQRDDRAAEIRSGTARLIDSGQMGRLFKALAAGPSGSEPPAGFEE